MGQGDPGVTGVSGQGSTVSDHHRLALSRSVLFDRSIVTVRSASAHSIMFLEIVVVPSVVGEIAPTEFIVLWRNCIRNQVSNRASSSSASEGTNIGHPIERIDGVWVHRNRRDGANDGPSDFAGDPKKDKQDDVTGRTASLRIQVRRDFSRNSNDQDYWWFSPNY
jgi:hypothetical protein